MVNSNYNLNIKKCRYDKCKSEYPKIGGSYNVWLETTMGIGYECFIAIDFSLGSVAP